MGTRTRATRARSAFRAGGVSFNIFGCLLFAGVGVGNSLDSYRDSYRISERFLQKFLEIPTECPRDSDRIPLDSNRIF